MKAILSKFSSRAGRRLIKCEYPFETPVNSILINHLHQISQETSSHKTSVEFFSSVSSSRWQVRQFAEGLGQKYQEGGKHRTCVVFLRSLKAVLQYSSVLDLLCDQKTETALAWGCIHFLIKASIHRHSFQSIPASRTGIRASG